MWITKREYINLIHKLDEIKAKQEEAEMNTERKIANMAKRILREPEKLSEELDEDDKLNKYIKDIIEHW